MLLIRLRNEAGTKQQSNFRLGRFGQQYPTLLKRSPSATSPRREKGNALSQDGFIPTSERKLVPYLVIDPVGAPRAKEGAKLLGSPAN